MEEYKTNQIKPQKINPSIVNDLKKAFRGWRADPSGKVSKLSKYLDASKYHLVYNQRASLSGMKRYPASRKLIAGDLLSVTLDGKVLLFANGAGELVGYISDSREYSASAINAIKQGSNVYGIVEGRTKGESGTRNRVHVILVETTPKSVKPTKPVAKKVKAPKSTQPEHEKNANYDEHEAKLEEEENLASIHNKLNSIISKNKAAVLKIDKDYKNYHPVDGDGIAARNMDMREKKKKLEKIEKFEGYFDSPYYAHIDILDEEGEAHKVLIGDEGISVKGTPLVYDWRNDIATIYTNPNTLKSVVKGKTYTLLLKRAVEIENAVLQSVDTKFDSTSGEFSQDVVDEFLLRILRDKRRQYKLTDIIRTIQHKQDEILRQPAEKSFIVQGCAGSGKTMVLLHRLSYLAFNQPNVDFSRYVIITPSDSFNDYLDGLNVKLELDRITKYSVESYYAHLIKRLSHSDIFTVQTGGRQRNAFKVVVPNSIELFEDHLGVDLLKKMYSVDFLHEIQALVSQAKIGALDQLASTGVTGVFEELNLPVPQAAENPYAVFSIIASNERRIRESLSPIQDAYDEVVRACDTAKEAIEGELGRVKRADDLLKPVAAELSSACMKRIIEIENTIEQVRSSIEADEKKRIDLEKALAQKKSELVELGNLIHTLESDSKDSARPHMLLFGDTLVSHELAEIFAERMPRINELRELEAQFDQTRAELASTNESIKLIQSQIRDVELFEQSNRDISSFISEESSAALAIRSSCQNDFEAVEKLKSERDALSVLAFGQRRRLNSEIERAEQNLEATATKALNEFRTTLATQIEKEQEKLNSLEEKLASFSQVEPEIYEIDQEILSVIEEELGNLRNEASKQKLLCEQLETELNETENATFEVRTAIEELSSERDSLTSIADGLKPNIYPDYSELTPHPDAEINEALVLYQKARQEFSHREIELLTSADERIDFLQQRYENLLAETEETKAHLDESIRTSKIDIVQDLSSKLDVRNLIAQVETRMGEIYEEHEKLFDKDVYYRHKLFALLALCGSYYNMRNQRERWVCIDEAQDLSVAEYSLMRSILDSGTVFNLYGDTSQLVCEYRGVTSWDDVAEIADAVFLLNENYRNTIQITDFCNSELSHSMTAIGLTGADVIRSRIHDAVNEVVEIKERNKNARIAIIHKRGLAGLREKLKDFEESDISWGVFDQDKVSIIDVEASKGLEFEAVVVVENCMTDNERYVSYTRALDNLIVTNIPGLSNVESVSVTSSSHADEFDETE